jgi:uncharacterized integral membrane protein
LKYLAWLLKAAVFFTLFAFALNNQDAVAVHFFFGQQWQGPLVLVVLAAFVAGLALGVMFMVPRWWRNRKAPRASEPGTIPAPPPEPAPPAPHGI